MKNTMNLDTQLVIAGRDKRYTQGAVNPVIQRASSLVFDTVKDKKFATTHRANGELFYGRRGTYTHFAFQKAMSELEGGTGCALYPCGAAAVTHSILAFVKSGDHILMTGAAYEPTQDFCNKILSQFGVETTYYDPLIGAGIASLIRPETRVVFLESPSSITMEVQDVPGMVKAIRAVNPEIVVMIDNTWSAGILFKALDYGVDISIQAGTKYTIGHSDGMIGTAVSNARCWERLRENSYLMGQTLDADSAYNGSRGLRTLSVRLKHHQESSLCIAQWLSAHPEVARVNHPALPECPGHTYFQRDFLGCSGLFSFVLRKRLTEEQLAHFLDNFTLFHMAYSWGGFESLILANQPDELNSIRPAGEVDFSGTLIRLHIGLEDVDDLLADLEAGLARIS
ncbi:cystathionine beta-lyase [Pantoea ananatis]|uniref:cystathionine beta-lyase n=1 Tax=Pantoea ananas TaxID=553 RepID=UPI0007DADCE7|nr:cystathionine beta-lyase [Pantoea ananatis]MCW0351649.1 Cystathionine beta-lyase MetC [Pantoea ananatis]USL59473.1 cystathionine beta-lyase [Pantoea ananatis]UYL01388.1 cystathionine beta-lyase [Pantoea ananatis]